MICKECLHQSYCDMNKFGGHVPPITACSQYKKMHTTNADRIRAMSDEQLADGIWKNFGGAEWCLFQCAHHDQDIPCSTCILEWLKAEVSEESKD